MTNISNLNIVENIWLCVCVHFKTPLGPVSKLAYWLCSKIQANAPKENMHKCPKAKTDFYSKCIFLRVHLQPTLRIQQSNTLSTGQLYIRLSFTSCLFHQFHVYLRNYIGFFTHSQMEFTPQLKVSLCFENETLHTLHSQSIIKQRNILGLHDYHLQLCAIPRLNEMVS